MNKKGHKKAVPSPSKGIQTRQEVIARAVKIAAQEGLGALSIGRLAKELRMSKSGLFIHFGSKKALELAVIERAELYFYDHIMVPIEQEGHEGIERVWYPCEAWLDLVENEILSGGYFFTGAFFTCAWQGGPILGRSGDSLGTGSTLWRQRLNKLVAKMKSQKPSTQRTLPLN